MRISSKTMEKKKKRSEMHVSYGAMVTPSLRKQMNIMTL